mmetsp:Transcript_59945/g.165921  ORF Transcript_59945/g.165921 Transcript_59945/m.165921 type:complete len:96 (-) Transcript_59945:511-798(-)
MVTPTACACNLWHLIKSPRLYKYKHYTSKAAQQLRSNSKARRPSKLSSKKAKSCRHANSSHKAQHEVKGQGPQALGAALCNPGHLCALALCSYAA